MTEKTTSETETTNDSSGSYQYRQAKSDYNIYGLKKAETPSVRDWIDKVPELRKISGLNSWRDICEHLKIPVEGDSARRRLKRWVETYRQRWPTVPEPKK